MSPLCFGYIGKVYTVDKPVYPSSLLHLALIFYHSQLALRASEVSKQVS